MILNKYLRVILQSLEANGYHLIKNKISFYSTDLPNIYETYVKMK